MRIQHNIAGINSYRNLGINQRNLNKNLEKLSSGYRINRAGDDAAGLAISEAMRAQINGLNQAAKTADDAIGLIQTAEGALTETHSMLQRMKTLTTQAANGTYTDTARGNIKTGARSLSAEIDTYCRLYRVQRCKTFRTATTQHSRSVLQQQRPLILPTGMNQMV